jgi:hypothetical protein
MSKRKASNTALPVAKRRQEELLAHITGNADLLAHLVSIAGRDVAQNITCANRATRVDMRRAMLRKGHTSVAAFFSPPPQQRQPTIAANTNAIIFLDASCVSVAAAGVSPRPDVVASPDVSQSAV